MQLSDYVAQICNAIESNHVDDKGEPQNINMTLSHQHMAYRGTVAAVLRKAFCGDAAGVSDMLFDRAQQVGMHHEQYKQAHQASLVELGAIKASKPIKPMREIQKAPKKGKI